MFAEELIAYVEGRKVVKVDPPTDPFWSMKKIRMRQQRGGRKVYGCPLGHAHPSILRARNCHHCRKLSQTATRLYREVRHLNRSFARARQRGLLFGGTFVD